MKTIVITGATGFVGQNLVRQLSLNDNYKLICIVRNKEKASDVLPHSVCCYYLNELKEYVAKGNIDFVINLASYLTSKDDDESIEKVLDANIVYNTRFLSVIRSIRNLRFINLGSFAEYRNGAEKPDTAYFYTAAKQAFRPLLDFFAVKCQWDYVHLIPYTIYGGTNNQKKLIDYVRESLNAVEPVKMSPGNQVSDFIHIDDVVSCICFFIDNPEKWEGQKGEVYHLGTGKGTSIRELAKLYEIKTDQKCNIAWGAYPYRERDVMHAVAPIGKLLDLGWKANKRLEDYI